MRLWNKQLTDKISWATFKVQLSPHNQLEKIKDSEARNKKHFFENLFLVNILATTMNKKEKVTVYDSGHTDVNWMYEKNSGRTSLTPF